MCLYFTTKLPCLPEKHRTKQNLREKRRTKRNLSRERHRLNRIYKTDKKLASHLTSGKLNIIIKLCMYKNPLLANSQFYHIYNRGVEKRNIFTNKWDYSRFLQTLNYYRKVPLPMKLSDFRRNKLRKEIVGDQKEMVKIYCYCLMPNHFHLLVQQLEDNGISKFLRKITDSYTRFFNTKHKRIGPLFQGSFRAKFIESDEYILQVSKYIHRNPFSLNNWRENIQTYPYSSYNWYLSNQKHDFCNADFISSYFSQTNPRFNYQNFVEDQEIEDPEFYPLFIDPEEED